MDDLGNNPDADGVEHSQNKGNILKAPSKIPFKFMDMHHQVVDLVIKPAIEETKILPETGNTIVTFNAHIDEFVPAYLQIRSLLKPPSKRHYLFQEFGIDAWINELAKGGHVKNVIWFKPPWTKGVPDGHWDLTVTNEKSGTESKIALYVRTLCRSVFGEVEEDFEDIKSVISKCLTAGDPYILDTELSFFSCDNSFTNDYENCPNYYKMFAEIFKVEGPASLKAEDVKVAYDNRVKIMKELEDIFDHLDANRTLPLLENEQPSLNYELVSELRDELLKFYEEKEIRWANIFDAGLVCNDYQLPVHYTDRRDIERMMNECVAKVLDFLPSPPSVVTGAVMFEYLSFTPKDDLDFIIDLIRDTFRNKFATLDQTEFIGY